MMDIAEISGLFRLFTFKLVVLLDVFSRFPLAAKVFFKEPTACEMAEIIGSEQEARRTETLHFGSGFSVHIVALSRRSRAACNQATIRSDREDGSIAIIDRFWRTMKEMLLLKRRSPLSIHDLWHRVEVGLVYNALWKPHQGLNGATPTEMYYGRSPSHVAAKRPRRAYELKDECDEQMFEISYLDPDCLLPVLKKAA